MRGLTAGVYLRRNALAEPLSVGSGHIEMPSLPAQEPAAALKSNRHLPGRTTPSPQQGKQRTR